MRLAQQVLDRMRLDEIGPAPALTFSSDDQHGWRRLRRSRGFTYVDSDGTAALQPILLA